MATSKYITSCVVTQDRKRPRFHFLLFRDLHTLLGAIYIVLVDGDATYSELRL